MQSDQVFPKAGTIQSEFIFATGIENSYPTVEWKGKTVRRDSMELSAHYDRWEEDYQLVKDLGIRFLRYGPPLYRAHVSANRYDWQWADRELKRLRELAIHPIVDLCHFGVPDWIGGFNNDDWPEHFARYARAFAQRFPWLRLYTPVNEIFVAAEFSGKRGWWNEREKTDRGFVTALKNLCKANLLAEEAILEIQPEATFVQSESSSYYHQSSPEVMERAYFENQRRFLPLDLSYGNDISATMYEYLLDNGMTRDEYHWFVQHGRSIQPHCVMGNDYYPENEHIVQGGDKPPQPSGEIFGYYVITHQYFDRYHLPVMHTETNVKKSDDGPRWLQKEWANILRLKHDGVPIIGFTWFSLIDQTDWDTAMREINNRTNQSGLFDKNRKPRPVCQAYKDLIAEWRPRLPRDFQSRDLDLNPLPKIRPPQPPKVREAPNDEHHSKRADGHKPAVPKHGHAGAPRKGKTRSHHTSRSHRSSRS